MLDIDTTKIVLAYCKFQKIYLYTITNNLHLFFVYLYELCRYPKRIIWADKYSNL